MRQIEIIRGVVESNKTEQNKRTIYIKGTEKFGIDTCEEFHWAIEIPFQEKDLKKNDLVRLVLQHDSEWPITHQLNPSEMLNLAINQIKVFKPNDRSEKDRHYQILITDLEKCLAYILTYLNLEKANDV